MEHSIDKGIGDLRRISMSQAEKEGMLKNLLGYAAAHPPRRPVRSPYFGVRLGLRGESLLSRYAIYVVSVCVIVLLLCGLSYAAESAVPGDPLYAVKVNINEPLRLALAASHNAKAQMAANFVGRRIAEAELMAFRMQLTPQAASRVVANIQGELAHASSVNTALAQNDSAFDAELARINLNAQMDAHARILSAMNGYVDASQRAPLALIEDALVHPAGESTAPVSVSDAALFASTRDSIQGSINSIQGSLAAGASRTELSRNMLKSMKDLLYSAQSSLNSAIIFAKSDRSADAAAALRTSRQAAIEAGIMEHAILVQ